AATEDIASTAGVSFSINHIAAVIIPALFGVVWLASPAWVFYAGVVMVSISFALALLIPESPRQGMESRRIFSIPGDESA
ncbi:MAG: hypothetical protein P8101_19395, partial [Candidatus Thiodiazotropha sp.]